MNLFITILKVTLAVISVVGLIALGLLIKVDRDNRQYAAYLKKMNLYEENKEKLKDLKIQGLFAFISVSCAIISNLASLLVLVLAY